jgi:hypothetical protein
LKLFFLSAIRDPLPGGANHLKCRHNGKKTYGAGRRLISNAGRQLPLDPATYLAMNFSKLEKSDAEFEKMNISSV